MYKMFTFYMHVQLYIVLRNQSRDCSSEIKPQQKLHVYISMVYEKHLQETDVLISIHIYITEER